MIDIIKYGNKKKLICEECGCVFTHEKEDVITRVNENLVNGYIYCVYCPCCDNEIETFIL